jgi:hypothetical protein
VIEQLEIAGSGVAAGAVGIALTPGRGQGPVLHGNFIHGFATGVRSLLRMVSGTDLNLDSRPFVDGNRLEGNDVAIAVVVDVASTPGRVRERSEVVNNFIVGNRVGYHATASCAGCGATTVSIDDPVINNTFAGNTGDAALLEGGDCIGVVTTAPDFTNNVFAGNAGRQRSDAGHPHRPALQARALPDRPGSARSPALRQGRGGRDPALHVLVRRGGSSGSSTRRPRRALARARRCGRLRDVPRTTASRRGRSRRAPGCAPRR